MILRPSSRPPAALTPPLLKPPDTPDSCRKFSQAPSEPPHPQAMPREPLFLAHCSLVPIQLATSSGSPSWLVRQAAGVRVFPRPLSVFDLPGKEESKETVISWSDPSRGREDIPQQSVPLPFSRHPPPKAYGGSQVQPPLSPSESTV